MDVIIKEILDKMVPWQIHAAGAVLIAALIAFFWYTFFGVHKVTQGISTLIKHDENIQKLWERISVLHAENEEHQAVAGYVTHVLGSIKPFIDALNELRRNADPNQTIVESSGLIQRLLDALTSDIKYKSGEHHRCCVWGLEGPFFKPLAFSSGFPQSYSATRTLDKDHSIAGRAFRTRQTEHIDDVTLDREWSRNEDSRSKYRSLICVPIGDVGVLTIDGMEPMRAECRLIGELYASVIEGAINEYFIAMKVMESQAAHFQTDEKPHAG